MFSPTAPLSPELSDLADLEPGLSIGSLAQALAAGDADVAAQLGTVVPTDDIAVALNTAFMGDGAVIRVAAGATLARPLHLVFANTGDAAGRCLHPFADRHRGWRPRHAAREP